MFELSSIAQAHDACRSLVFDAMEETLMIARGYRDQGSTKVLKHNETSTSGNTSPTRRCHELTLIGEMRQRRVGEINPQHCIDADVKANTQQKCWSRPRKSAAGVLFCVGGR